MNTKATLSIAMPYYTEGLAWKNKGISTEDWESVGITGLALRRK